MITHREKRRIGRSLLTNDERRRGVAWFSSEGWAARSAARAKRIAKKQEATHARAEARRKDEKRQLERKARAEEQQRYNQATQQERAAIRRKRTERFKAKVARLVAAVLP